MNRRQFSSGLLGAAGAIGLHRLANGTPQAEVHDACATSIRFIFAGLTVFRPSNGIFEVGVLRARPNHILQINIKPTSSGDTPRAIDPNLLETYVQKSDRWSLDVKDQAGTAVTGVQAATQIPSDRHVATNQSSELGWIVNVESGEFHGGKVNRLAHKLKPIITLNSGLLGAHCLTESVDIFKGNSTKPFHDNFGFIAGATGLCIDISAGQTVVLKTETLADILVLKPGVSYDIEILNGPIQGSPTGGHFHLYYDLLFTGISAGSRFSFKPHPHTIPSPVECHVDRDPDPYKCGGIMVNEGSGPLG